MKKIMIVLTAMLTIAATGNAMSYEQARNEALFLTDKMAYELNLNDEQYEAAYEINLDYLMGVTSYDDVYGTYWERRNLDMSYILLEWQWNAFCAASYFYRPLYWTDGVWHFGIYARYPRRDYFYFGRPVFYASYRGGHAWHHVGGRGYYYSRSHHYRPAGRSHFGMLDRWNRGDFHNNHRSIHFSNGRGHLGGVRNSSTRTTVHNRHSYESHNYNHHSDRATSGTFSGGGTSSGSGTSRPSGSYEGGSSRGSGSFGGGSSRGSSPSRPTGSFSGTPRPSSSLSGTSRPSSSINGTYSRASSSFNGSSSRASGSFSGSSSRASGSFGGGSSRSSGSFGGSSRGSGSFGGGHSSAGGSHGGSSRGSGSFRR
jgi:uncharacterized membrane protein YgcG